MVSVAMRGGIPLGCAADKVDMLELLFGDMTSIDQKSVHVRHMCSLISAPQRATGSGQKEINLEDACIVGTAPP